MPLSVKLKIGSDSDDEIGLSFKYKPECLKLLSCKWKFVYDHSMFLSCEKNYLFS